jgi:outer membrane biosynthesis protein TonB
MRCWDVSGRRWVVCVFSIFCLLLVVWVIAAMVLNAAAEGSLPISMHVYSDLYADYSPDVVVRPLGVFNLAIISETLKDRGYSEEEVEERAKAIEVAMNELVPTATALNYEGDLPPTATPTVTYTPTPTSTPTPTLTPTSTATRIPTKTPTKTPTPKPPKKPKPSNTPTEEVTPPSPTVTPLPQTDTPTPTDTPTLPPPPSGHGEDVTESVGVDGAGDCLGPPDGDYSSVGTGPGSVLIIDLGGWAPVSAGTQLAVYEHLIDYPGCHDGIYQDQQVVSVGTGAPGDNQWTVVFIFGDGPGEAPNTCISSGDLYDTSAYLIDLGGVVSDPFRWVRFQNFPVGDPRPTNEQVQVDAINVLN